MDEIKVEFLRGETVPARVVSSEPAADLSLLQLERVPSGSKVAPMADSSTVQVGDDVIIVGAPYGLSHSLSAGHIRARWSPNTDAAGRVLPDRRGHQYRELGRPHVQHEG